MKASKNSDKNIQMIQSDWGQGRNEISKFNDWDVLLIRDYHGLRINSLLSYDVIILDYGLPEKADELIRKIRASAIEELYLMPVYIYSSKADILNTTHSLIDGKLDNVDIASFEQDIVKIKRYIDEFKQVQSDYIGRNLLLKLLRFLLTRERPLVPIPTHLSLTGYSYPFLEASMDHEQHEELSSILDIAVERGFLTSSFVDMVHLCSNCHSGFINYREICPTCGTRKLKSQHAIHHFICGYVGPESDFYQDKKLICPKCSRQLRHIGVDYDKPSVIMECENGHVFQEPGMETFCLRCHDVNELDNLIDYEVKEYALTNVGIETATSGNQKSNDQEDIQGVITFPLFKSLVKLEGERQKQTNSSIAISYVNFVFSTETLKSQLNQYQDFVVDLIMLFKNLLKPTDLITIPVDDIILVFSAETDAKETKQRLEKALKQVQASMIQHKKLSVHDKLLVQSFDMTKEIGVDKVFDQINQEVKIQ